MTGDNQLAMLNETTLEEMETQDFQAFLVEHREDQELLSEIIHSIDARMDEMVRDFNREIEATDELIYRLTYRVWELEQSTRPWWRKLWDWTRERTGL